LAQQAANELRKQERQLTKEQKLALMARKKEERAAKKAAKQRIN
jgi:hypothetical protein